MSSRKTSHLKLNKWDGPDLVSREEFNANFDTLDAEAKRISDRAEEVLNQANQRITQVEQDAINRTSAHINATNAHKADNIEYVGAVTGQSNVRGAIDAVNSRVNNIVGQAGTSNTEIVDARMGVDGTAHTALKNRLDRMEQTQVQANRQSQTLTHGVSVLNASVGAPVDVRIEGRTLISLQNTVLEIGKYYVLADKKTSVKWADTTTNKGVTKFTGRAEKPAIIRVANFEGKVSASTVENPHVIKPMLGSSLLTPTQTTFGEASTSQYGNMGSLNGTSHATTTSVSANIAQHLFSFDLIAEIERNIGRIPKATTAEKVQWIKDNVSKLTANWHGFGSSVGGNKSSFVVWSTTSNGWLNTRSHTLNNVGKLEISINPSLPVNYRIIDSIDNNGFVHFLAYADPSDGTTASTINTDYIELEIELKQTAQLHDPLVPLYEVNATDYAKILVDWNEADVINRFPKVQGVQHLQNPAVIAEGENLLPPFYEWTLHANAKAISPYELETNATGSLQSSNVKIDVIGGQTYTISYTGNGSGNIWEEKADGTSNGGVSITGGKTITMKSDTKRIRVEFTNTATGIISHKNPMLTLGSVAKPFVPRNPSYLFAPVKLGQIGTAKDTLLKQDGEWRVRKEIEKDFVLDGSLTWVWNVDYSGYKRFRFPIVGLIDGETVTKYDGKLLKKAGTYADFSVSDTARMNADGYFYIVASDTETGFGETYNPITDEIKAYFNGWQAKTVDANGKPTAWRSLGDGTDAPTQTLAYVSANKAPNFTPYKLSYVLATPKTETVQVEGDIVANGLTQVEVTSGVIVREKVTPAKDSIYMWVNAVFGALPTSQRFKNKALKVLGIYRNGQPDKKWTIQERATNDAYGIGRAFIVESDYDATAEYTVTYLMLDRHLFTLNATNVNAQYANYIRSALDDVVTKQGDIATTVSINVKAIVDIYARIKAGGL